MTDPGTAQQPNAPGGARRHRSEQVRVALIGAAATVVTAAVPVAAALLTDNARVELGSPQPTPTVTATVETTVTATPEPPEAPEGTEQPPDDKPVVDTDGDGEHRSGEDVTMGNGNGIDLDSEAENWGADVQGRERDVNFDSGGMYTPYGVSLTTGQERSYATCNKQVKSQKFVSRTELLQDATACVKTSEGRWSWVKIRRFSTDPVELSIDVLTWKKITAQPT